jgi:hypothetical protein
LNFADVANDIRVYGVYGLCDGGLPAPIWMDNFITEDSSVWLRGWLEIHQVTMVTCGFPAQSETRAETHVGLHVKCQLLLTNFNQNCRMSTNFSENLSYQNSLKKPFSGSGVVTDEYIRCGINEHIFSAFICESTRKLQNI